MKTVYVSLVAMVLLMGVVVLVSASQIDGDYEIEKGWNLIPGFIGTDQLFGDDILIKLYTCVCGAGCCYLIIMMFPMIFSNLVS